MPLDPFLVPLLANLPPLPDYIDDFAAFRAQESAGAEALAQQLMEPGPDVAFTRTFSIPVDGGSIDLVLFQPHTDGPHPVHLYIHGGGWIGGSAHSIATANTCQRARDRSRLQRRRDRVPEGPRAPVPDRAQRLLRSPHLGQGPRGGAGRRAPN